MQGETLGILRQKLEYKENEGFLCLVAQDPASNSIVGVVEISLRSDKVPCGAACAARDQAARSKDAVVNRSESLFHRHSWLL